jgi:uncharacterized protein with PQ loop repeat
MNNIGLIGSLILTFSALPELVRTIKDKKCHMGWGFLLMWLIGEIFCVFYGFDLKEVPLIMNYTFNLGVALTMFIYKLKEVNLKLLSKWKLQNLLNG